MTGFVLQGKLFSMYVVLFYHQGEALETVTTAAVCLFSSQTQLADQVPPLGHLPRVLTALHHKNNAVPKSAIRLLHVLSDNEVQREHGLLCVCCCDGVLMLCVCVCVCVCAAVCALHGCAGHHRPADDRDEAQG